MGRLRMLLVVLLASAAYAKPFTAFETQAKGSTEPECWQKCPDTLTESQKLRLEAGKTIVYSYIADTVTSIHDTDAEKSGLQLEMAIHIDALSTCQARLRLSDVVARQWDSKTMQFINVPSTDDYKTPLESKEIVFTYVNGQVQQVCKHQNDQEWVANIKRAILSMLQLNFNQNQSSQIETDIAGECPVSTTEISTNKYQKVKRLESCSGHSHLRSTLESAMYQSLPNSPKSLSITEMKSLCSYTLNEGRGIIQDVLCEEQHLLRPFRNGENGARTVTRQKLSFPRIFATNINKISVPEHFVRSRLPYVPLSKEERNQGKKVTAEDVAQLLWRLCQMSKADVRPQTPQFFTELIYQMRLLDVKQLQTLSELVKSGDKFDTVRKQARTFFYDALATLNTDAGFQMMASLLNSNELSDREVYMWISGLSFLQEAPSRNMILSVKSLLEAPKLRQASIFGVTTMLSRYCRETGLESCQKDQEMVDTVTILLNHLNGDCTVNTGQTKNQIITILKGLGNIGLDIGKMSDILKRCTLRKENPISIRVAAVQSIQRLSCDTSRADLDVLLMDPELDSELRIHVYLANMRCPTIETLKKVKDMLEKEKVNQVGSFIWTHLTNLQETDDPLKKDIHDVLQTTTLKQEFNLDKLKFSRNIEKSFFSKDWNLGGQFESNLIWSQESFFPRSVSMNVTADLFGAAVNFLELTGRVEHADKILEKLFHSKKDPSQYNPSMYLEALKELEGSLGMRIFGRDVGVLYADGTSRMPTSYTFHPFEVIEALLSGRKFELQKNLLLVESGLEMPTAMGLPLSFNVNVSSSVDLQYFSQLEYIPGQSGRLENHLQPSASLLVSAQMAVDSIYGKYGVKLGAHLHTSSHVVTSISYDNEKGLHVEFNMPKEKQEILSLQSEVFVVQRDEERDQRTAMDEITSRMVCTGNTVETLLGMQLCAAVKYPDIKSRNSKRPLSPLRGPLSAHLTLIKRDTHKGYLFAVKAQPTDSSKTHYRWEVNTPQSKLSRHFLAELEFDMGQRKFKVAWKDPWRSAGLQVELGSKDIVAKMHFNNQDILLLEGHRAGSYDNNEYKDEATFDLRIPLLMGSRSIQANAGVLLSEKQITYRAEIAGLLKAPISLNYSLTRVSTANKASLVNKMEIRGTYSSPIYRGELVGNVEHNSFSHKVDLTLKHQKVELTRDTVLSDIGEPFLMAVRHKWKGSQVSGRTRHDVKTRISYGFQAQQYVSLTLETEMSQRHANLKSLIDLNINSIGKHSIANNFYAGFVSQGLDHTLQVSGTFSYLEMGLNITGKLHSKMKDLHYQGELELLNERESMASVKIDWVNKGPRIFDSELSALINVLNKRITLENTLHEVSLRRFENKFVMQSAGTVLKMSSVLHLPGLRSLTFTHSVQHPALGDGMKAEIIADFDNLAKSIFKVTLDFVGSPHKYGMEGTLRFTPGKEMLFSGRTQSVQWLEFSVSSWMPLLNATQKLQFVLTPKHFLTSLQSHYNTDEVLRIHAEFKHDDLIARKFVDLIHLRLHYPGRQYGLQFQSDFQYLKFSSQIELSLHEGKKITLATMYDIDDGWTEKGITASTTLTTPYLGYERIHMSLYGLGQLRYRKLEVQYHWGKGKRVVVDLTVQPKSTQDFTSAFRIITPFTRMSYLGFHVKHFYNGKQINTETRLDLGPQKNYGVALKLSNNGDNQVRNYQGQVKISAYRLMKDVNIQFSHRDDLKNFKTDVSIEWGAKQPLSVSSNVDFMLEKKSLRTRGNVQINTPWVAMNNLQVEWNQMNTETSFLSTLKIRYNQRSILEGNVRGSFSLREPYRVNANFDFKLLNEKKLVGSYDFTADRTFLKSECRISINNQEYYYDKWTGSNRDGRLTVEVFMNVPFLPMQTSHFKFESTYRGPNYGLTSRLSYGEDDIKVFDIDASLDLERERINTKLTYASDLTGGVLKHFSLSHKMDMFRGQYHIVMKTDVNDAEWIAYEATADLNEKVNLKLRMNTRFELVNSLEISMDHLGHLNAFNGTYVFTLNDQYRLEGKLKQIYWRNVSTSWQIRTPQFTKSLEVKHEWGKSGVKHRLSMDLWRTAKFSYSADLMLYGTSEIQIETPFPEYCETLQLKLDRADSQGLVQILHTTSTHSNKISGQWSMKNEKYQGSVTFKVASYQGDASVSLQKNVLTNKWEFRVSGMTQGRQSQIVITFDPNYSQASLMLQTPFKTLSLLSANYNMTGTLRDFYHSHSFRAVIRNKVMAFENVLSHVGSSFAELYSHVENTFDERFNYTVKYMHRVTPTKFHLNIKLHHKSIGSNELLVEKPVGQSLTVKLTTGCRYLQEIYLTHHFSKSNTWDEMKHMTGVRYRLKDSIYAATSVLQWTRVNYIRFSLKVETPHPQWASAELEYTHVFSKDTWTEVLKIFRHEVRLERVPQRTKLVYMKGAVEMIRLECTTTHQCNFLVHQDMVNDILPQTHSLSGPMEWKITHAVLEPTEALLAMEIRLPSLYEAEATLKYRIMTTRQLYWQMKLLTKWANSENHWLFEGNRDNSRLQLKAATPFKLIRTMNALMEFDGRLGSYVITMERNDKTMFNLQMQLGQDTLCGLKKIEMKLDMQPVLDLVQLQWDCSKESLDVTFMSSFTGLLSLKLTRDTFQISIPNLYNFRANLGWELDGRYRINTKVTTDLWGRGKLFLLDASLSSVEGNKEIFKVDLQTPIEKWQRSKLTLTFQRGDDKGSMKLTGRLENEDFLSTPVVLEGGLSQTSDKVVINATYRAPIPGYESGVTSLEYTYGRQLSFKIGRQQKLEPIFFITVEKKRPNGYENELVISTSLDSFRDLQFTYNSTNLRGLGNGVEWNARVELALLPTGRLAIQVNSPITALQRLEFKVDWNAASLPRQLNVNMHMSSELLDPSIYVTFNWDSSRELSVSVQTPFLFMHDCKLQLSWQFTDFTYFRLGMKIQHEELKEPIEFRFSNEEAKFQLMLKTPFQEYIKTLDASLELNFNQITAVVRSDGYLKFDVKGILSAESNRLEKNVKIEINPHPFGKVELTGRWTYVEDGIEGALTITSPLPGFERQAIVLRNVNSDFKVTISQSSLSRDIEASFTELDNHRFQLLLETPFNQLHSSKLVVTLGEHFPLIGVPQKIEFNSLELGDWRLTTDYMQTSSGAAVSCTLETPTEILRTTTFKLEYGMESSYYTVVTSLTNSFVGRYELDGRIALNPTKSEINIKVITPLEWLKSSELLLRYSLSRTSADVTLLARHNLQNLMDIQVKGQCSEQPNFSFSMDLPYWMKPLTMEISSPSRSLNVIDGNLRYNQVELFSLAYAFNEGKLIIKTFIKDVQTVAFTATAYKLDIVESDIAIALETSSYGRIKFAWKHAGPPASSVHEYHLKLENTILPYLTRDLSMDFVMNFNSVHYFAKMNGYEPLRVDAKWTPSSISVEVDTPIRKFERNRIYLEMSPADLKQWMVSGKAEIQVGTFNYAIKAEMERRMDDTVQLRLTIPGNSVLIQLKGKYSVPETVAQFALTVNEKNLVTLKFKLQSLQTHYTLNFELGQFDKPLLETKLNLLFTWRHSYIHGYVQLYDQRYETDATSEWDGVKTGSVVITSSSATDRRSRKVYKAAFLHRYVNKPEEFELESSLKWMETELGVKVMTNKRNRALVNLQTPLKGVRGELKYEYDSIKVNATPGKQLVIQLLNEYLSVKSRHFWSQTGSISGDLSLLTGEDVVFKTILNATIVPTEMSLNTSLQLLHHKANVGVTFIRPESHIFTLKVRLNSNCRWLQQALLTTNLRYLGRMELDFDGNLGGRVFDNSFQLKSLLTTGARKEVQLAAVYNDKNLLEFKAFHEREDQRLHQSVTLTLGGVSHGYQIKGELSPMFVGDVLIHCPWLNYPHLKLNSKKEQIEEGVRYQLKFGEENYLVLTQEIDRLGIQMKSPFKTLEDLDFTVEGFKGKSPLRAVSFRLGRSEKPAFRLSVKPKTGKNLYGGKVNINSVLFPVLDNLEVDLEHEETKPQEWRFRHSVHHNSGKQVTLQGTGSLGDQGFHLDGKADTHLGGGQLRLLHQNTKDGYKNEMRFVLPNEDVYHSSLNITRRPAEVVLFEHQLVTPPQYWGEIVTRFQHESTPFGHKQEGKITRVGLSEPIVFYSGNVDLKKMQFVHKLTTPGVVSWESEGRAHEPFLKAEVLYYPTNKKHFVRVSPVSQKESNGESGWKLESSYPYLNSLELFARLNDDAATTDDMIQTLPAFMKLSVNNKHWIQLKKQKGLSIESSHPLLGKLEIQRENQPKKKLLRVSYGDHSVSAEATEEDAAHSLVFRTTYPRDITLQVQYERTLEKMKVALQYKTYRLEAMLLNNETLLEFDLKSTVRKIPAITFKTTKSLQPLEMRLAVNDRVAHFMMNYESSEKDCKMHVSYKGDLLPVKPIRLNVLRSGSANGALQLRVESFYNDDILLAINFQGEGEMTRQYLASVSVKSFYIPLKANVETKWNIESWSEQNKNANFSIRLQTTAQNIQLRTAIQKMSKRCYAELRAEVNEAVHTITVERDAATSTFLVKLDIAKMFSLHAIRNESIYFHLRVDKIYRGRTLLLKLLQQKDDLLVEGETPCRAVRTFSFKHKFTQISSVKSCSAQAVVNDREILNMTSTYAWQSNGNIVLNVTSHLLTPFEFAFTVKTQPQTLQLEKLLFYVNWRPQYKGNYVLLAYDQTPELISLRLGHREKQILWERNLKQIFHIKITRISRREEPAFIEILVKEDAEQKHLILTTPWRSSRLSVRQGEMQGTTRECQLELCLDTNRPTESTIRLENKVVINGPRTSAQMRLFYPGRMDRPATLSILKREEGSNQEVDMSLELTENMEDTILLSVKLPQSLTNVMTDEAWNVSFTLHQKSEKVSLSGQLGLKLRGETKAIVAGLQIKPLKQAVQKYLVHFEYRPSTVDGLVHANIATPVSQLRFTSTLKHTVADHYQIHIENEINAVIVVRIKAEYNATGPAVSLLVYGNADRPQDVIQVTVGYKGEHELAAKITARVDQLEALYLDSNVQLLSQHLVKSKFFIKTGLCQHLGESATSIKKRLHELIETENPLKILSLYFSEEFFTLQDPIHTSEMKRELNLLVRDLHSVLNAIKRGYANDDFYLRTMNMEVQYSTRRALKDLHRWCRIACYNIKRAFIVTVYSVEEFIGQVRYLQHRVTREVVHWAMHAANSTARVTHFAMSTLVHWVERIFSHVNLYKLGGIQLLPSWETIHLHLRPLIGFYQLAVLQVRDNLSSTKYILNLVPFEQEARVLFDQLINYLNEHARYILPTLKEARRSLEYWLNNIITPNNLMHLGQIIKETVYNAKWFLENVYTVETLSKMLIEDYLGAIQYIKDVLLTSWGDLLKLNQFYFIDSSSADTFSVETQIYSPFVMKDLKTSPNFHPISTIMETVREHGFGLYNAKLWHTFQKLYEDLMLVDVFGYSLPMFALGRGQRSIWPQFEEFASLTPNHVVTFDKKHFTLKDGGCDYVLVTSARDNSWSIYTEGGRKVIVARFGSTTVKMNERKQVSVNGDIVDLPVYVGEDISIYRYGRFLKLKANEIGVTLTADLENELVTVGVTRWHHGKLRGLFGNMDAEPYNDFITKDQGLAMNEAAFLKSWTSGSSCSKSTDTPLQRVSQKHYASCEFLFKFPFSPLASCFKYVDPRPFEKLCLEEGERKECTQGDMSCSIHQVCRAVNVYVSHCQHANVKVDIPKTCGICNGQLAYPMSSTFSGGPSTRTEVVFITEEGRHCNNKRVIRELAGYIKNVNIQRGIKDVRFAVVGYNQAVHTHTFNGKVFAEEHELKKFIDVNQLHELNRAADLEDGNSPAMRAIEYATYLPFQGDSNKQMIMIPCNSCGALNTNLPPLLKQMNIHFSAILSTSWSHNVNVTDRLYAVDKDYTYNPTRSFGSPRSRALSQRDGCFELALQSGGIVYDRQAESNISQRPLFYRMFTMLNHIKTSYQSKAPTICYRKSHQHYGCRHSCYPHVEEESTIPI